MNSGIQERRNSLDHVNSISCDYSLQGVQSAIDMESVNKRGEMLWMYWLI